MRRSFPGGTRQQADELDGRAGTVLARRGGPPDGLMLHRVRPDGDGLRMIEVWRTEPEMRSVYAAMVLPWLAELELAHEPPSLRPVWGFARPRTGSRVCPRPDRRTRCYGQGPHPGGREGPQPEQLLRRTSVPPATSAPLPSSREAQTLKRNSTTSPSCMT